MKNTKVGKVIKILRKKYNKKDIIIEAMLEKCKEYGYNIDESKEMIRNFLE